MSKSDILITGSLVDTDLIMAEHLSRVGLRVNVVRRPGQMKLNLPKDYVKTFSLDHLYEVESPLQFVRLATKSKLLLSITGSLLNHMRELWPARKLLNIPPIINITTGSDITELATQRFWKFDTPPEQKLKAVMYRNYLKSVDINWCLPLPHGLKNIVELKLRNVVFMNGFPYLVPKASVDEIRLPHAKRIRFFHCSHLDWNLTNFSKTRNSTKGNDKFIRAFIRAHQEGFPIELWILDRGADRAIARDMFIKAGVDVHWLPNLTREELYKQINLADIVVNMFAHGGAGGISFEALALGRPVMQYANPTYFQLMYGGSMPPFVNCHTEKEIYRKIIWCCETEELSQIAAVGKQWVADFVAPEKALTKFLFYFSVLTGDARINFGDFIEEMKQHVEKVSSYNVNSNT